MAGKPGAGKPKGKTVAGDKSDGPKKPAVGAVGSSDPSSKESPLSPDPLNPVKVPKSTKSPNTSSLKKNPLARGQPGRQRLSGAQKRKRHWASVEAQKQAGGNGNQGPAEKRMRGNRGGDLRGRLSGPRVMQQVQNQQMLLNMTQQRLGGPGPMVDVDTAKQLQNMLNIVLDQTNKLQNQLPRSVWHRIAPPDNNFQAPAHQSNVDNQRNPIFRDRFVQNMGPQDIVITTPNPEFGGNPPPVPLFDRPTIDRSKIMPAGMNAQEMRGRQDNLRGISESMQGRNYRKNHGNDWNPPPQVEKSREPIGNKNTLMPLMESIARPPSPKRSLLSPPRAISPPRRYGPSSYSQHENKRQLSPPPRRQASSPRREATPPARKNPYSEIFHRRPAQNRPQNSDNSRRAMSPARRDHSSGGRGVSPPKRFSDDWDMNRGSINQGNWNQRQQGQMPQQRALDNNLPGERRWNNDKPDNSPNWNSSSLNERFRPNTNKRGSDSRDGMWMSGGGDVWNSKQMPGKSANERQWPGGNNGQGIGGDQWNSRGNDSGYGQANNRNDDWRNSGKADKQWMDMGDDSKDPWGDEPGTTLGKSRWQPDEPSNSNWRRNDKIDQNWSNKSNDNNWQNKTLSMSNNMPKPLWPSFVNQNSNDQQRWMPQNDQKNSNVSNVWWSRSQSASNNRRQQNFSGFSEQPRQNSYGSSNYKDGR